MHSLLNERKREAVSAARKFWLHSWICEISQSFSVRIGAGGGHELYSLLAIQTGCSGETIQGLYLLIAICIHIFNFLKSCICTRTSVHFNFSDIGWFLLVLRACVLIVIPNILLHCLQFLLAQRTGWRILSQLIIIFCVNSSSACVTKAKDVLSN